MYIPLVYEPVKSKEYAGYSTKLHKSQMVFHLIYLGFTNEYRNIIIMAV